VVVDVFGTTCPVTLVRVAEFRVAGFLECAAFSACCAAGIGVWVCGAEVWYLPGGDLRRGRRGLVDLGDLGDLFDLIESREADWAGADEGGEQQQQASEEKRGEESHFDLSFLSDLMVLICVGFDVVGIVDFDFLSNLICC
jgi:hypothetical protein